MIVEELDDHFMAVHCEAEIRVAVRLNNGLRFHAPILGVAYRRFRACPYSLHKGTVWILADEPCQPVSFNPWELRFRVKP